MKAISIQNPWATFIRDGMKTIETRTWKTKYRGRILLCASATRNKDMRGDPTIAGKAFAVATLKTIQEMTIWDEERAMCRCYPRAQSWFLTDIKIIESFDVKGQLSLFEVEYEEPREEI